MAALLRTVIVWAIGGAVARLFSAFGIAFLTYQGITYLIDNALSFLQSAVTNIAVDLFSILAMAGVFESMSILASTFTAIAAVKSARVFLGVQQ